MEKAERGSPARKKPPRSNNPGSRTTRRRSSPKCWRKSASRPALDRVEVCRHHNGKYRVNIWQQPELNKNIAVTPGSRIGPSYYLTVSDTGEIIDSNPPMTKVR